MRPLLLILASCVAVTNLSASRQNSWQPQKPTAASADVLVRGVTLIDGTDAPPRANVSIAIRDRRITTIAPADATADDAALVINGTGLFAIPGLFDAHVHLSPSPWDERVEQLGRLVKGGVTSVFDVAGDVRETSDFARAVLAGDILGPSIDYCALMAGPAFFSDPRVVAASVGYTPGDAPWNRAITPDVDLVEAVAAARGSGARAIKLYAALDAPTVSRIADEARRQGLRVIAHATVFPAKPSDLVDAGVNILAHSAYLVWEGTPPTPDYTKRAQGDFDHVAPDSPVIERLLASMKARNVALNPTLYVFTQGAYTRDPLADKRVAWGNAVTRRAAAAGVTIVAGTDALLDRNGQPALLSELELLVSGAGLTPGQALTAATRNAADGIGVAPDRGTLEAGKAADIVLLDASPLDDIRNIRKIRFVVKDGRVVFNARAK